MTLAEKCPVINFADLGDERGKLVVIEGGQSIPFDIQRVFYIYGSDDTVVRGQHANKKTEFVRTLKYLARDRQIANAKETLELYAPLANRLGLYSIFSFKSIFSCCKFAISFAFSSFFVTNCRIFIF